MAKRAFLIVLDSFGIGAEPDAAAFGDEGTNTLGAIAAHPNFNCPNLQKLGMSNVQQAEQELTEYLLRGMQSIPHIHVLGSEQAENHTGIVAFTVDQVHPHDISEILSSDGMDIRAGHHCAEPLHQYLGIHSSARASVMFYNTKEEADRFLESVSNIRRRMGYGE